ncbi:MAG: helix-turn-helix domain-containing protein [Planctomycetaceae bacterium]
MASLADQIREAVADARLTPTELSQMVGTDRSVLSKFLRGERETVSFETASKIVEVLQLCLIDEKSKERCT